MEIDIGIEKTDRITTLLNAALADLNVLTIKTKKFHWNLEGPRFRTLHEFFQEQYEDMDEAIDDVAERIRMLGGETIGTMDEFLKASILEEKPEEVPEEDGMLEELLTDHENVIKALRKNIAICEEKHDFGSADMLTDRIKTHEKYAWMLRSFLA